MKILITGSEGLIGTAIFERLKKLNIDTIHFDKKFPLKHPYYGDILNKDKLEAAVADCDGIVHLAAVSRVIWGEKNPELCWKTNYEGTCSVVESALLSPKNLGFFMQVAVKSMGNHLSSQQLKKLPTMP